MMAMMGAGLDTKVLYAALLGILLPGIWALLARGLLIGALRRRSDTGPVARAVRHGVGLALAAACLVGLDLALLVQAGSRAGPPLVLILAGALALALGGLTFSAWLRLSEKGAEAAGTIARHAVHAAWGVVIALALMGLMESRVLFA